MPEKNYLRHTQTDKHLKKKRRSYKIKNIRKADEQGKEVSNEDIERKTDKRFLELEGIKYCDSCNVCG